MIFDVKVNLREVNIMPASELEEIIQNVQMIVSTMRGTVPLDRAFGIDTRWLDEPTNVVQARAVGEITSAVNKQEPRARVQKVFFTGELDGSTNITVRIEVVESKLRGYVTQ